MHRTSARISSHTQQFQVLGKDPLVHTHTPSALETFSDGLYNLTLTFYFSLICRQINPDLLLQITSKCTGNIGMWYKNEKDNARNGLATLKGPTAKRR